MEILRVGWGAGWLVVWDVEGVCGWVCRGMKNIGRADGYCVRDGTRLR